MDAPGQWDTERAVAVRELQMRRAEATEASRAEAQQAERQAAAAGLAMHATLTGRPVPGITDILRQAAAEVPEPIARDPSAEYGSAANVAILVDGADVGQPRAAAARAARSARDAVVLMRARKPLSNFMRRELARAEVRADAARAVYVRDEIELLTHRAAAQTAQVHGQLSRSAPGRVNGSAVTAIAERRGIDDTPRDKHGEAIRCVWVPDGRGGYRHDRHPGRCLVNGGGGQRYES